MEGIEKVLANLQNIKSKIDSAVLRVVTETTLQVEADAKKSMKSGEGGLYHSAPGEPPYVQTGVLRDNVTDELPKLIAGQEIVGKVGVRDLVDYAPGLEFGAPAHTISNAFGRGKDIEHPGNLPRPFLRPALAANMSKFKENMKSAIASIIK